MKILITAANSAQAHKLKNKLTAHDVILGDHHELPAFMLNQGKMMQLPNPQSPSYTHQMLTLCMNNEIEKVYVLTKQEADLLMEAAQLFNEYNIEIQVIDNEV